MSSHIQRTWKARLLGPWQYAAWILRESLSGRDRDYTQGPIGDAVLLLAIPMVLEMSMESIFVVVDIFFVAKLGAAAVASVGLTEAVLTLLYAVAIGLSMGATALVARRIGEKNPEAATVVAAQCLWVGLILSAVIGAAGIAFAPDILRLMGGDPEVVRGGSSYTAIMLGGSATILFIFLFNAIFRGAGDAVIAMRALWIANGINIVLDPLLIFGIGPLPELGVTGAAVATTIGRGIGVLYQVCMLGSGRFRITLKLRNCALCMPVMLRLLRVSLGGVFQFLIATSSYLFLMRIVARHGSTAVAGFTIAIRIFMFTFLPAWGLGNAAATLVGQNLGAGDAERAERSVWRAALYNTVFLIGVAIVFILFAEPLVAIFTADPVVQRYAADCLRIVSYGYGLYAVGMVVTQAFNGAGDTDTPTWINFACFWLLQIPLAFVLAETLAYGAPGVYAAVTIAESILAIVAVAVFRRGRWKLKSV